ncbi:MAG: pseudouridine-5'-phosphate glycosidase, partial [Mollicutes bacterium]|nr:pseudouridine-5'-phosphate glycosidase [Mollicutes bacterium]
IDEAILEMNKLNIKGKDQTPFLLSKIVELTNGSSLETNIELILSNARLGAKIASSYYKK